MRQDKEWIRTSHRLTDWTTQTWNRKQAKRNNSNIIVIYLDRKIPCQIKTQPKKLETDNLYKYIARKTKHRWQLNASMYRNCPQHSEVQNNISKTLLLNAEDILSECNALYFYSFYSYSSIYFFNYALFIFPFLLFFFFYPFQSGNNSEILLWIFLLIRTNTNNH